jgi:hypothetical protein
MKSSRQQKIVRVEEVEHFSRRPSETLVDRVGLATVGGALPMVEPWFILSNDFYRSIGAPSIDNKVLETRIALQEY